MGVGDTRGESSRFDVCAELLAGALKKTYILSHPKQKLAFRLSFTIFLILSFFIFGRLERFNG
ncbi:MAG: hypothetical protein C5B54_09645 [Acidobacteria bacterium]|nr:MAG: hypothetical protein C5B54_09645 [Acidobacteriota bacterium]